VPANCRNDSGLCGLDRAQERGHERHQIGKAIGHGFEDDDGNWNGSQILLKREISRNCFNKAILRLFQKGNDLYPSDRRKALQKLIDGLAGFDVVEQRLHGDTRPAKHGSPAHDLGITATDCLLHVEMILPISPDLQRRLV
jgi:hypothetical protein